MTRNELETFALDNLKALRIPASRNEIHLDGEIYLTDEMSYLGLALSACMWPTADARRGVVERFVARKCHRLEVMHIHPV